MRNSFSDFRHSFSFKAAVIGLLSLALLIPVAMVRGVIHDRQNIGSQGRVEINRSWGGAQTIAGPVLVLPYTMNRVTQYGEVIPEDGTLYLLPDTLAVDADIQSELRYRGAHSYPVYTAETTVSGTFLPPDWHGLGIDTANIDWARAAVAIGILDPRYLRSAPILDVGGIRSGFEAGDFQVNGLPPLIVAPVASFEDEAVRAEKTSFSINFTLSGSDEFRVLPLGDNTTVEMRSNWGDPSFVGAHLPERREVTDSGFTADWRISSFGRSLPSRWLASTNQHQSGDNYSFGVKLYIPIGLYQLTDRATKYAIMFIGLTFVAYFLFEILAGLRVHPLQYLLVGFGNALFYLLLLSLAEHMWFGLAYMLSAGGSIGLIAGYSYAVLGSRRRAASMMAILAGLYSFLYLTLNAESYALLAGSIGLWFILAGVMYLTRKIDWYGARNDEKVQGEMSF